MDALEIEQVCGEYEDGPGVMKASLGNTRFGNCVVAQVITRFSSISNNITSIDADTFRTLVVKLLEKEDNDPQGSFFADSIFPVLDPDGKGSINWKMLGHGILLLARGSLLEKIRLCFQMIDIQQKGRVDQPALVAFLERFWEQAGAQEALGLAMLSNIGADTRGQDWAELRPDRIEDLRADTLSR